LINHFNAGMVYVEINLNAQIQEFVLLDTLYVLITHVLKVVMKLVRQWENVVRISCAQTTAVLNH